MQDWNQTESWKDGFVAAVRGEWAPYSQDFWAPQDDWQFGWNAGKRALAEGSCRQRDMASAVGQ